MFAWKSEQIIDELTRLVDEAWGVTKFVLKNELIQELASQGIKHTPEDIVVIGRNPEGKILWLEKGNAKVGLEHIVQRYPTGGKNNEI